MSDDGDQGVTVPPAAEQAAKQAAGAILYLLVNQLAATGMRRGNAFRLAAALLIEETMGVEGLKDCGVPVSTMYRWKAEAKAHGLNAEPMPVEPPAELVERVSRLLAGMPVQRD